MKTAAEIEKLFVIDIGYDEDDSEDRNYLYVDEETGREFNIRQFDQGDGQSQFFLEEFQPAGVWDEAIQRRVHEEKYRKLKETSTPNDFSAAFKKEFPPNLEMIRAGGGLGVGSIFYASITECATAIETAIRENIWYKHFKKPPPPSTEDKLNEARSSLAYWEAKRKAFMTHQQGMFAGTHNLFGESLSDERRFKILSYINSPTESLWNEIYGTVIAGGVTLWQAWTRFNRHAPCSKPLDGPWPLIPEGEELRESIISVIKEEIESTEEKIAEIKTEVDHLEKALASERQVKSQPKLTVVSREDSSDQMDGDDQDDHEPLFG